MEKKQLFNNSLVGFHPNTFIPFLELDINIDDYDIYENFTIEKDIALDDNFIDIYNKTEKGDFCSIRTNITNNNDDISKAILSGYKGSTGLFFRDVVILQTTNRITITNLDFTNIDISSKTASIVFIRKVISQSDSNNTVIHLTTTINGLTNLNPGNFNETVTLIAEEYNALNEIPVGEVFILVNDVDTTTFLIFKSGNTSFRASRDYINNSLTNRLLISFIIDLGENNQATFKGNITRLMDFNNYLAKDNTTEYTPTNDYNPATKKYVDGIIASKVNIAVNSFEDKVIDMSPYLINNKYEGTIKVYSYNFDNEDFHIRPVVSASWSFATSYSNTPHSITFYSNNKLINCIVKAIKNYCINIHFDIIQQILTESEYAALGTTPNTNNVLYFVTPD